MGLNEREQKTYAIVIGDGSIRVTASENDPKAVKRVVELPDKSTVTKIERIYNDLSGFIKEVTFFDGKFGKQLFVKVDDNQSEPITLALNMSTNFGEDFLKKLPNVDFAEQVTISPFSFEDDKGKTRKGVTIRQLNNVNATDGKIKNFFANEKNEAINGFPIVPKPFAEMDNDDWKIYFIQTRKFLIDFAEKNVIPLVVNTADSVAQREGLKPMQVAGVEIEGKVSDIDFGDKGAEGISEEIPTNPADIF